MRTPEEVAAMLRPRTLGGGVRRIAAEFGCSHMTVRRYLAGGGWVDYQAPRRGKALDGLESWLAERFRRHRGNADVVRQDLEREHGIVVSLRIVERAVAPLRRELQAEARARETRVAIGGASVRTYLFVATLGYSSAGVPA